MTKYDVLDKILEQKKKKTLGNGSLMKVRALVNVLILVHNL